MVYLIFFDTFLYNYNIKLYNTILKLASCGFIISSLILVILISYLFTNYLFKVLSGLMDYVVNMNGPTPPGYNNNQGSGSGPRSGQGPGGKPNTINFDAMLDQVEKQVKKIRNKYHMSIKYILNDSDT